MNESGLTKNQVISELTRSPHGDLVQYVPTGKIAAREDPEFFSHLIAWNEKKGSIRDSKVALPVVALASTNGEGHSTPITNMIQDNALAHLVSLDPRNLVRAVRFAKDIRIQGHGRSLTRAVERYLRVREAKKGWWIRAALRHKESLKTLYALHHIKPSPEVNEVVMQGKRPKGSVFEVLVQLKDMEPITAAGEIARHRIPFPVALGALGARAKEEAVVLALIDRMTPTELVTNTKALERLGVKAVPALRAAYEQGLQRVAEDEKIGLKAQRAAGAQTDAKLKRKLVEAQDKQLEKGTVEGDWLVLADKSSSMGEAIQVSQTVSSLLARLAGGKVHLIFFDTTPRHIDVTGKTYDEILKLTCWMEAGGMTSIGCGLQWALDKKLEVDGIAVISDAAENTLPYFAEVYTKYSSLIGKQVPVYLYHCGRDTGRYADHQSFIKMMNHLRHDLQTFSLLGGVDYNSLPNLVSTMRTQRYGLVEEIMNVPLLTLDGVLADAA